MDIITHLTKGGDMKYLIILAIMSVAGTFGVVNNSRENVQPQIPVQFIDIAEPLHITSSI